MGRPGVHDHMEKYRGFFFLRRAQGAESLVKIQSWAAARVPDISCKNNGALGGFDELLLHSSCASTDSNPNRHPPYSPYATPPLTSHHQALRPNPSSQTIKKPHKSSNPPPPPPPTPTPTPISHPPLPPTKTYPHHHHHRNTARKKRKTPPMHEPQKQSRTC